MELFDVFAARHSIRAFTDQPVPDEALGKIFEAVNRAPSAGNLQAFEIYQVTHLSHKEALMRATLTLVSRHGPAAATVRAIAQEAGTLRELFEKRLRRPLGIAVFLAVFQQVTEINTVIYYGSLIFKEQVGGQSDSAAIGANVIIGTVNFLMTIVALWTIDRLGRLGVVLTTSSFLSFVVLQIAMLSGIVTNAYVGLIVYLVFPVLFVLGSRDQMTPPKAAQSLIDACAQPQVVLLAATGHAMMAENPDGVRRALASFAQQVFAASAV